MKILLLNGPNLDRLGSRQPEIYGYATLSDVVAALTVRAEAAGATLDAYQSADASAIIERIASSDADAIIINPASLTHHDRGLADALRAFGKPVIEVHISNIAAREPFRRRSMISPIANGSIVGLGVRGYDLALDALLDHPR